jgi:hypothetical protein
MSPRILSLQENTAWTAILAKVTRTILRLSRNSTEESPTWSRGVAKDAAPFWDRRPSRQDSVTGPPTTFTFAPRAGSSSGSRFHRLLRCKVMPRHKSICAHPSNLTESNNLLVDLRQVRSYFSSSREARVAEGRADSRRLIRSPRRRGRAK